MSTPFIFTSSSIAKAEEICLINGQEKDFHYYHFVGIIEKLTKRNEERIHEHRRNEKTTGENT